MSLIAFAYIFTHLFEVGIDICKEAVASAIKWARDGANASLLRLQKIEAANEFAAFVDRLILGNNRLIFLNCNRTAPHRTTRAIHFISFF